MPIESSLRIVNLCTAIGATDNAGCESFSIDLFRVSTFLYSFHFSQNFKFFFRRLFDSIVKRRLGNTGIVQICIQVSSNKISRKKKKFARDTFRF